MRAFTFLGCTVLAFSAAVSAAPASTVIPNEYVIILKPGIQAAGTDAVHQTVQRLLKQASSSSRSGSASVLHEYSFNGRLSGFAATMSTSVVDFLAAHPEVSSVEKNQIFTISAETAAPVSASALLAEKVDAPLWGIDSLDGAIDGTYHYSKDGGSGVDAYIIDTGIFTEHPDFEGRASWGGSFVSADKTERDGNGHGTHCAGTIGSKTFGVAKAANLIAVKVLNSQGSGSTADIIAGMDFVVQAAAKSGKKSVANMSLGGRGTSLNAAAKAMIDGNVALAVAAGNSYHSNSCNETPAGEKSAFTVAASDKDYGFAYFSDVGPCVDIIAPGVDIQSTLNKGAGNQTMSGTSMATPHVVGALAVAYSQNNFKTPADAFTYLLGKASTDKITDIPDETTINKFLQL